MLGLMQNWPLTVDRILDHAKAVNPGREIITRRTDGAVHRTTYAQAHLRAKQVSNALRQWGIQLGDRVATLAWNSERHLECWYGAMGIGAVLHTLNPRLHPQQIAWIINHAADRVLIFDTTFLPIVEAISDALSVEHYVIIADSATMPANSLGAVCYEDWIAAQPGDCAWGGFDENTACGLCYTSGTTGDPKGVLYSHRSNVLHSLTSLNVDAMAIGVSDVVMPVVPMFHANTWGLAFACPTTGASMVMPGAQMDGASLYELLDGERVTITAAVPTIWMGLLQHLRAHDLKLPYLRKVIIGGAALPAAIQQAFEDDYGVPVIHAWGMTETSPLGSMAVMPPALAGADPATRLAQKLKQGRPPFGVELKIVDDAGAELPHDSVTAGHLKVRGFAVAAAYFNSGSAGVLDEQGYFNTGDVATIDCHAAMKITDRAKDVIKSGGEWISSIELENIAVSLPGVANAAAIGVPNPKWDERPVLIVEAHPDAALTANAVLAHLDGKIAKWWMPDEVVFVDAIPLGGTGKIDKVALRRQWLARQPGAQGV
jgi:fatty-acyl-CoA synthase